MNLKPGCVLLHKATGRLMRLVIAEGGTFILHNCELAVRVASLRMVAWSGDAAEFARAFRQPPADAQYPASAR